MHNPFKAKVSDLSRARMMPIDKIRHSDRKQRCISHYSAKRIGRLKSSIQAVGILYPLLVRSLPNGDVIVFDGDGRLAAARQLGIEEVPVIVLDEGSGGQDSFSKGFVANLVRDDFLVIEVALNIKAGLDEGLFTRPGLKEMSGFSDEQVSQYLSYLKNCPELIEMIREEGLKKDGKASLFGHAVLRHLSRLRDPEFKEDQLAISRKVIEEELGSEAVGTLVDNVLSKSLPSSKSGNRKPASHPLPIPGLPTGVKGRIKQGQMRLEFRWETQEDLLAAIAQVTELLQQPGFVASLLPPPKPDCSTPAFWQQGMKGVDGLGSDVPCVAGTVGSTEGKEVNK